MCARFADDMVPIPLPVIEDPKPSGPPPSKEPRKSKLVNTPKPPDLNTQYSIPCEVRVRINVLIEKGKVHNLDEAVKQTRERCEVTLDRDHPFSITGEFVPGSFSIDDRELAKRYPDDWKVDPDAF